MAHNFLSLATKMKIKKRNPNVEVINVTREIRLSIHNYLLELQFMGTRMNLLNIE